MGIHFYFLVLLGTILSCGKQEFPDYNEKEESFSAEKNEIIKGSIRSLNGKKIKGNIFLTLDDDQFYIKVEVSRAPKNMRIQQFIHSGAKCPGTYSDLNSDGRIDYEEILIASGVPLIPLDKKLNSWSLGNEWFPETDEAGTYTYSRSGSLRLIKEDLDDQNLLDSESPLNPRGRTIIFFGSVEGPLHPIGCVDL